MAGSPDRAVSAMTPGVALMRPSKLIGNGTPSDTLLPT